MNGDHLLQVCKLFEELIHETRHNMYEYIDARPEDIRVAAPQFMIDLFERAIVYKYSQLYHHSDPVDGLVKYQGLTFIPTYQMEIAIFHKDYPLYKNEWMLTKLSLLPAQTVPHGRYSEIIINLQPLINRKGEGKTNLN